MSTTNKGGLLLIRGEFIPDRDRIIPDKVYLLKNQPDRV